MIAMEMDTAMMALVIATPDGTVLVARHVLALTTVLTLVIATTVRATAMLVTLVLIAVFVLALVSAQTTDVVSTLRAFVTPTFLVMIAL